MISTKKETTKFTRIETAINCCKNENYDCTENLALKKQKKVDRQKMNDRDLDITGLKGGHTNKAEVLKRYQHILYIYSSLSDEDNNYKS